MFGEGQGDVLHQRKRPKQRAVLKQHAHVAAHATKFFLRQAKEVVVAYEHLPGLRARKPDNVAQQG